MIKWIAAYSILMGVLQTGTWAVLIANGSVARDIAAQPAETIFLLVAEFMTAGAVILARRTWGIPLDLAAMGMMLYCVIFSTGVFGQLGVIPAAIFFAVVSLLTAASIAILLDRGRIGRSDPCQRC